MQWANRVLCGPSNFQIQTIKRRPAWQFVLRSRPTARLPRIGASYRGERRPRLTTTGRRGHGDYSFAAAAALALTSTRGASPSSSSSAGRPAPAATARPCRSSAWRTCSRGRRRRGSPTSTRAAPGGAARANRPTTARRAEWPPAYGAHGAIAAVSGRDRRRGRKRRRAPRRGRTSP